MRTILFVCTGNTCRSPMAEAIARHWIGQGGLGDEIGDEEVFVASAGVFAAEGSRTTAESLNALRSLGIEHEGRAKPLTADMIRKAHVVLCMTAGHEAAVRSLAGNSDPPPTIGLLDEGSDVDDPFGMGQEAYDDLCRRMMELIPRRLKEAFDR